MKKLFYGMAALALLLPSCESDQAPNSAQETQIDMSDFYVHTDADGDETSKVAKGKGEERSCYTMDNLNRLLNENPGLEKKMYDIEYHTRQFIAGKKPSGTPGGGNGGGGNNGGGDPPADDGLGTITIPVHFIVVYANSSQNVNDQMLSAQVGVLNTDFSGSNPNDNEVPNEFAGVLANTNIQFTLDSDIERHSNSTSSWGSNDAIKSAYPPKDPSMYLNIWVCNLGGGLLGYAQFPGGPSSTDGVVVLYSSLPNGGATNYEQGRTATHEVGHYLNLRHIWGDGRCRQDDFVSDTPSSDRPNYYCPGYPTVHCSSADMTMNYMDYVYDDCMYMFTDGQRSRMRAIFASGGSRAAMIGN